MRTCMLTCVILSIACATSVLADVIPGDVEYPESEPTNRVKVAESIPASYTVPSQAAANAAASVTVTVKVEPAKAAEAVRSPVVQVFAAELAKAETADVPKIFSAALAKVDSENIAPVLAVALEKAAEADIPRIAAALYASLVKATVKDIQPAELVKVETEWYERFHAVGGSKLYWILKVARERAEQGEDVSRLKAVFDATMNRWLMEE